MVARLSPTRPPDDRAPEVSSLSRNGDAVAEARGSRQHDLARRQKQGLSSNAVCGESQSQSQSQSAGAGVGDEV